LYLHTQPLEQIIRARLVLHARTHTHNTHTHTHTNVFTHTRTHFSLSLIPRMPAQCQHHVINPAVAGRSRQDGNMSTLGEDGNMSIVRTSFCQGTMTNDTYPHSYQHAPSMPPAPLTASLISSLINLDCTTPTRTPELLLCVCVDQCEGKCTGNPVTTSWSQHNTAKCTKQGEDVLFVM